MEMKSVKKFMRKMRGIVPISISVIISLIAFMLGVFFVYNYLTYTQPAKISTIIGKCTYYSIKIKQNEYVALVNCGNGYKVSSTKVVTP